MGKAASKNKPRRKSARPLAERSARGTRVQASRRAPAGKTPARTGPRDSTEIFPKLAELIGYLRGLRGRADLGVLTTLLSNLDITAEDLAPACVFGTKGYRRNVIDAGEHHELLCLTWRSGHCTPIHDHRGVSCAFRVVEGVGTEIRFATTPSGLICPGEVIHMQPGYVCAAADADIHQVANMNEPGHDVVTLHIYSPRIKKMHTYEFKTTEGCAETGSVYDC